MARIRAGLHTQDVVENTQHRRLAELVMVRPSDNAEGSGTGDGNRDRSNHGNGVNDGESETNSRRNDIGYLIRSAREGLGLTQIELAVATGYSNGWISSIERGVFVPSKTFLLDLESVLGEGVLGAAQWIERKKLGECGSTLMTPTEVGKYLGMSRPYVYNVIHRNELPYITVDGYIRINVRDLARFESLDMMEEALASGACSDSVVMLIDQEESRIRAWLSEYRS